MFSVIACIRDDHDFRLIVVAAVICLIGSFATMLLFSRAQECQSHQRRYWIAAAAFASGVGIWATHFIAMLAYESSLPISYGVSLTVLSVVLAIIGSWLAIAVAFEWDNRISFTAGGLLIAFGIAALHFTGMPALSLPLSSVPASRRWPSWHFAAFMGSGASRLGLCCCCWRFARCISQR